MPPIILDIKILGDPVLRRTARRLDKVTEDDRDLLSRMAQTMYASAGIGLAAVQVGIPKAMIVVDIGSGLYKLINPKVVHKTGTQSLEEGCLSVPGICVKVKRAQRIVVNALDENGKDVVLEAQDLLACVLQHEIDHLKGKLIVDYASFLQRAKIKKQIKALKQRRRDEPVSQYTTQSCKVQL